MADERRVDPNNEILAEPPIADSQEVADVLEVPVAMTPAEIDERAQVVDALRDSGVIREPSRDTTPLGATRREESLDDVSLREPPLRG